MYFKGLWYFVEGLGQFNYDAGRDIYNCFFLFHVTPVHNKIFFRCMLFLKIFSYLTLTLDSEKNWGRKGGKTSFPILFGSRKFTEHTFKIHFHLENIK